MNIYSDYPHTGKDRAKQKKKRREKKNIDIPIPPHTKRYMDSKEKGMNEYAILSSHQTRQRMKARENVKR